MVGAVYRVGNLNPPLTGEVTRLVPKLLFGNPDARETHVSNQKRSRNWSFVNICVTKPKLGNEPAISHSKGGDWDAAHRFVFFEKAMGK